MAFFKTYRVALGFSLFFYCGSLLAQTVAELTTSLNAQAGIIRNMGPQTNLKPPLDPKVSSALSVLNNPMVIAEIERMENRLEKAAKVLANPNSASGTRRAASERMAQTGPKLIRLLEARANLVTAFNTNFRTSGAQALGVKPYAVGRRVWLVKTLQIVKDVRGRVGSTPQARGEASNSRLARGIDRMFSTNAYGIQNYFSITKGGRGRAVPTEPPNIIVDPAGNATIRK